MGYLRLYLALCVLKYHSIVVPYSSDLILNGVQAVQCFFVLSGFFMALTLQRHYHYAGSVKDFYWNRLLRIFPAYWAMLILIFAAFLYTGNFYTFRMRLDMSGISGMFSNGDIYTNIYLIVTNLFIVGQDILWLVKVNYQGIFYSPYELSPEHNGSGYSLNAPAFTLALEIYFYLVAPFIIRKKRYVFALILLGLCYHVAIKYYGLHDNIYGYHMVPASIYFFAIGMGAYVFMQRQNDRVLCILAYAVLALAAGAWGAYEHDYMYLLTPMFAIIVSYIYRIGSTLPLQSLCGSLSYVIYITHFPISRNLQALGYGEHTFWVSVGVSLLIIYCVEKPLAFYKRRKPVHA